MSCADLPVETLEVNCPAWPPILFRDNHDAGAPLCRFTRRDGLNDPSFHIILQLPVHIVVEVVRDGRRRVHSEGWRVLA